MQTREAAPRRPRRATPGQLGPVSAHRSRATPTWAVGTQPRQVAHQRRVPPVPGYALPRGILDTIGLLHRPNS